MQHSSKPVDGVIMQELLTTRQVQAILKVDRTTIYRMLREGRLHGIKVGQQWRFRESDVTKLLQTESAPSPANGKASRPIVPLSTEVDNADPFLQHVQSLQDVFARLGGIASVTTDLAGLPCTTISNSCAFCNVIFETHSGRQACIASWQALAHLPKKQTRFYQCHAGLRYARSLLEVDGYPTLMLVVGQFLRSTPTMAEREACIDQLAQDHGLERDALREAVDGISILSEDQAEDLQLLLAEATVTLEQIGKERAELLNRLRRIASMSALTGHKEESRPPFEMVSAE
jgi:excisionase family DNA binding protein